MSYDRPPASLSVKLDLLHQDTAYPGLRSALLYARAVAAVFVIIGAILLFFPTARSFGFAGIFSGFGAVAWAYIVELLIDVADAVIARSS